MGMWKLASQYQTAFPVEMSEAEKQVFAGYPIVKEQDNCVSITWKYWLPGTGGQTADLTYQIYGDGTVHMEAVMDPKEGLADMPEFGILMKWDAAFSHLKWYGRGPVETYCDRNHAKIDVYANAVKDNVQPYIVPQETGNHNGTRWAEISDEEGNRVRLMSMQKDGMDFSAIPYTPAQLEEAKHPYELPASSYTVVRCNLKQMGVGGDNSWGAQPLEEYHLKPDHRLVFDMAWKVIPASRK
jgi:beta-galactosidase